MQDAGDIGDWPHACAMMEQSHPPLIEHRSADQSPRPRRLSPVASESSDTSGQAPALCDTVRHTRLENFSRERRIREDRLQEASGPRVSAMNTLVTVYVLLVRAVSDMDSRYWICSHNVQQDNAHSPTAVRCFSRDLVRTGVGGRTSSTVSIRAAAWHSVPYTIVVQPQSTPRQRE